MTDLQVLQSQIENQRMLMANAKVGDIPSIERAMTKTLDVLDTLLQMLIEKESQNAMS